MLNNYGFKVIVKVKCNVLNYLKVKSLRIITLKVIKLFFKKCIFYKYKILIKFKVNSDFKNKREVIKACNKLIIIRVIKLIYNFRS